MVMSCVKQERTHDFSSCQLALQALESREEHREFLEEIYRADQGIRDGRTGRARTEFGESSSEYQELLHEFRSTDRRNFHCIESYLRRHGHPTIDSVGSLAASAPWLVIHHVASLEQRYHYFPMIYEAYTRGDIDEGQITLYLTRMHLMKFEEHFRLEGAYYPQALIDSFLVRLDLLNRAREIEELIQ